MKLLFANFVLPPTQILLIQVLFDLPITQQKQFCLSHSTIIFKIFVTGGASLNQKLIFVYAEVLNKHPTSLQN